MPILQPIKPQYCELIASGKKTIEVRKTRPKLQTPFKVYIYMTKSRLVGNRKAYKDRMAGKVIGEYVCDEIQELRFDALEQCYFMRKACGTNLDEEFMSGTCLSYKEAYEYCKNLKCDGEHTDMFYGWHISDLKIYDKPKELSEFYTDCAPDDKKCQKCSNYKEPDIYGFNFCKTHFEKHLIRPPQSWCYVEEV